MLKFSTHVKQGENTNGLPAATGQEKAISFEGIAIQLFGAGAAILGCVCISVMFGSVF